MFIFLQDLLWLVKDFLLEVLNIWHSVQMKTNIPVWLYSPAAGNCFLFFLQDLLWLVKDLMLEDLKILTILSYENHFESFWFNWQYQLNMMTGGEIKIYSILDLRLGPKFQNSKKYSGTGLSYVRDYLRPYYLLLKNFCSQKYLISI